MRPRELRRLALVLTLVLAACEAGGGAPPKPTEPTEPTPASEPPTSPAPTSDTPDPSPTTEPPPRFEGSVSALDPARVAASWRPGCPVPVEDLRLLTVSHWGFDGTVHAGELVVHEDVAEDVVGVMRELFEARFPIRRMELVDEYGADDDASMAANNTSAFNCRPVTGGSSWSQHSYGWAIDINPVQNPYVTAGGTVLPPAGTAYLDRSKDSPGLIHGDDVVVAAFAAVGWEWGGDWTSPVDYQHFSRTGR